MSSSSSSSLLLLFLLLLGGVVVVVVVMVVSFVHRYGKVLDRLAGDCGRDLVDRSMAFVLASRDGMSDDELLWSMKVPRMGAFSTLLLAMREQLCTRSAFMTFFHDDARLAVERQARALYPSPAPHPH